MEENISAAATGIPCDGDENSPHMMSVHVFVEGDSGSFAPLRYANARNDGKVRIADKK